jgi:hypothetical protein
MFDDGVELCGDGGGRDSISIRNRAVVLKIHGEKFAPEDDFEDDDLSWLGQGNCR